MSRRSEGVFIRLRATGGEFLGRLPLSSHIRENGRSGGIEALGESESSGNYAHQSEGLQDTDYSPFFIHFEWQIVTDLVTQSTRSMLALARDWLDRYIEGFEATEINDKLIQRLSIILISSEIFRQRLIECLEETVEKSRTWQSTSLTSDVLDIHLVWLVPFVTAILSFSFFLFLVVQVQPSSHALVVVGIISLGLVECLVPLALTGCTALFWFDVFSAETALLVLFFVWAAAVLSSRCIRHCLYSNLMDS